MDLLFFIFISNNLLTKQKFILLRTYYMSFNNGEYLAIDFGTCNSVISLIQNFLQQKLTKFKKIENYYFYITLWRYGFLFT